MSLVLINHGGNMNTRDLPLTEVANFLIKRFPKVPVHKFTSALELWDEINELNEKREEIAGTLLPSYQEMQDYLGVVVVESIGG